MMTRDEPPGLPCLVDEPPTRDAFSPDVGQHTRRKAAMARWTISPNRDHLLRDGHPDVVVADTVWAALHSAEPEHFESLVKLRAEQGFNTIMMSLLPLAHDWSGLLHHPFQSEPDGSPDYSRLDEAWLERAVGMVEVVTRHGLTPMLMLQWVDYVPGSWAALSAPERTMSAEDTKAFVQRMVPAFAHTQPIWSTSGDDTFNSSGAVERHSMIAELVRQLDPDAVITSHTGAWINFPAELAGLVDFIGYQSSHGDDWATKPQHWNRYVACLPTRMPSMNLEPAYEAHGYGGGRGRFTGRDVRLASWRSMITGAGAGIGYGAHGVWSWHREGQPFSSEGYSSMPFDVEVAMRFSGASDIAWLGQVARLNEFWLLKDRSDLLFRDHSGATVGGSEDLGLVVVHSPDSLRCEIELEYDHYDVTGYDILARCPVHVRTSSGAGGRTIIIETPRHFSEFAYVLRRRHEH